MYYFGKSSWRTMESGTEKEWLVTNGIGGYASGTIINANTRKYHGLLISALKPPGWRVLQLAKLDERFSAGPCIYILAANENRSGFAELGFVHLQQVKMDPFPTFTYSFGDIILEKTVFMIHGRNTTAILYRVFNGAEPGVLFITPMVNSRGHHFITCEGEIQFTQDAVDRGVSIKGRDDLPPLFLTCSTGDYIKEGYWYKGMAYAVEKERGENPYEDHYIPGRFEIPFEAGENKTFTIIASSEEFKNMNGEALLAKEKRRIEKLVKNAGYKDHFARRLVRSADAFIVQRQSTGKKTVIAGYPWFCDWGRDAMISLPGLTLVNRRYQEARDILITYAKLRKKGLLPNAFFEGDTEPVFNTVDASLWFVNAVYKYLIYTGDLDFVRDELYPAVKEIIKYYAEGTEYNIGMDRDGLLKAGSPDIQLTWMDAKVDNWVVTPRHGKAVEINALWYNAVMIYQGLCSLFGDKFPCPGLPGKIKNSFIKNFWLDSDGYLCDVLTDEGKDCRVRPNQLLAVSLPFKMVGREQGLKVVRRVWRELYVTYGIRSLTPWDYNYRGVYSGDRLHRDGSYHQGTAWSWLIGPFITAYRWVHDYSPGSRVQAQLFISPFRDQLEDHGVGYISEIFDGDEPAVPRGCIAQAWGVAEVLRAYVEDVLEIRPPAEDKIKIL